MKPSEQRLSEARHQHTEAIVARHLSELFQRLPMLAGFWLRPDLDVAEVSVFTWPGYTPGGELYEEVMRSLVAALSLRTLATADPLLSRQRSGRMAPWLDQVAVVAVAAGCKQRVRRT